MTDSQARKAVERFHEKKKHLELVGRDGGCKFLSRDGQALWEIFKQHSYDDVHYAITEEIGEEHFASVAGIRSRLSKKAPRHVSREVNPELQSLGHKRVVRIKDSMDYGVVDLGAGAEMLWVCQSPVYDEYRDRKPEWTLTTAERYTMGMATPVSEVVAEEVKADWRRMDEERTVECMGPAGLYRAEPVVPGSAIGTTPEGEDLF